MPESPVPASVRAWPGADVTSACFKLIQLSRIRPAAMIVTRIMMVCDCLNSVTVALSAGGNQSSESASLVAVTAEPRSDPTRGAEPGAAHWH